VKHFIAKQDWQKNPDSSLVPHNTHIGNNFIDGGNTGNRYFDTSIIANNGSYKVTLIYETR